MQIRLSLIGLLSLLLVLPLPFQAQDACRELRQLYKTLQREHVQPRPLDSQLAEDIWEQFLHFLDPKGLFLHQVALQEIASYKRFMISDLRQQSCQFLPRVSPWFTQQLRSVAELHTRLQAEPLDFSRADVITLGHSQKPHYVPDEEALALRWQKWLKHQVLKQVFQQYEGERLSPAEFDQLREEAERRAWQKAACQLSQVEQTPGGLERYVIEAYLQAICTSFDPHTRYFPPLEKEAFERILAKNAYSFGLNLRETQAGEWEIARLVPGGSAWKSQALNRGDIILEIRLDDQAPLDLLCTDAQSLMASLDNSSAYQARLRVRKSNGQRVAVTLYKAKSAVEENLVTGFVLEGSRKMGYIYLPGFYTEWEGSGALTCTNDLSKELLRLQMEGIEGLILDLRANGGGSMAEALGLAGLFIDYGPLSVAQARNERPTLLKDFNRGTLYDGPLVLMVNEYSASASEILAAALQDYQRAVIVGSKTYGKASGQIIVPLNSFSPTRSGFAKVTVQTFYRVTGKSHQRRGVLPDIELPSIYAGVELGEAKEAFALQVDSTDKEVVYRPLLPLPLAQLSHRSESRLKQANRFQAQIIRNRALAEVIGAGTQFLLMPEPFMQEMERVNALFAEKSPLAHTHFSVNNHRANASLVALDPYRQARNQQVMNNIQRDVYIEEAYFVLADLISLAKP